MATKIPQLVGGGAAWSVASGLQAHSPAPVRFQVVTRHSPGPEVGGLGSRSGSAAREETKIAFLLGPHVLPRSNLVLNTLSGRALSPHVA